MLRSGLVNVFDWVSPKQTMRQGFEHKWLIEEVIPENPVRGVGKEKRPVKETLESKVQWCAAVA